MTNTHIVEYLDYYLGLAIPPNYAVMLDGPWGSGKTHFIKRYIADKSDRTILFVSLYGTSSAEDIDEAIKLATYPFLGIDWNKSTERVVRAFLRHQGTNLEEDVRKFFRESAVDLIVFDDLERSLMPVPSVLGYINGYVEHSGNKVVICANQQELEAVAVDYPRIKEKLVGRAFLVRPEIEDATDFFIHELPADEVTNLLQERQTQLLYLFKGSETLNLRLLRQAIHDLHRLLGVLDDRQRANGPAIDELVDLMLALIIEYRAARISEEDLKRRTDHMHWAANRMMGKEATTGLNQAVKRYPGVELQGTLLSDYVVTSFIVNGVVEAEHLRSDLDKSGHFLTAGDEPAWRILWHYFERTDEELVDAANRLEREFADRCITDSGHVLHMFGVMLRFADVGVVSRDRAEVFRRCKDYISDLANSGRLKPLFDSSRVDLFEDDSYDGLFFMERDTEEFRALVEHLISTRIAVAKAEYPKFSGRLLNSVRGSMNGLAGMLADPEFEGGVFYTNPILSFVDSQEFASAILSRHPGEQRRIFRFLKKRFSERGRKAAFPEEWAWLIELRRDLLSRCENLPRIGAYRLRENINAAISSVLEPES